jgi:hypothetical protein
MDQEQAGTSTQTETNSTDTGGPTLAQRLQTLLAETTVHGLPQLHRDKSKFFLYHLR